MALTGRTALVALLGALLAPLGPGWLAGLTGLLAAGVLVDLALAGRIADLRLARSGATTTRLGETVTVTLLVGNAGRRRARGVLRDAWVPSAGASPRVHRLDVPAGQRRRLACTLTPTRRGDRTAARVTVRLSGPLGLACRQRRHAVPWSVRVLPPFTSRKFLPEKLARLRALDGAVTVTRRGQGTEFDSLREYVMGDDVRSIDWRATARRGEVVVRTWRPERDRRLVCVLDTGRTSAARVGDTPRLDAALDACLLLSAVAARAGDRVDLLAADDVVRARVTGLTRAEVLPRLVDAMAALEPTLIESDPGLIVSEVLRQERKRCLVVWFTALDAAPVEFGLLPALGPLTARHTVLVASVGDPAVSALATGRGDAAGVYGAAAAERALADRRRVTATLRRRGVLVVDEPADVFASRVTDAYLGLKAAGRL
ncbi:MAG: DUF58 domain-containing protein [Actinobacteria bacterium]|nr:DUF58 domain-containing protein [Actinomycetota bacterium]MBI3687831.1 DUF58 domain-containing protein [Actinomycetota bacterium]